MPNPTVAEKIKNNSTDWSDLIVEACNHSSAIDTEDDFENETTIVRYSDGSSLKLDGICYECEILN